MCEEIIDTQKKYKKNGEERKDSGFVELCEYVKKNLLKYDDNMKMPTFLVLRLKGMNTGTYIPHGDIKYQACYDYNTILTTCKICRPKIEKYFSYNGSKIKNEQQKINIVMKFIENEINDVYIRLQNANIAKEKAENIDNELDKHENMASYQRRTKDNRNTKLDSLF